MYRICLKRAPNLGLCKNVVRTAAGSIAQTSDDYKIIFQTHNSVDQNSNFVKYSLQERRNHRISLGKPMLSFYVAMSAGAGYCLNNYPFHFTTCALVSIGVYMLSLGANAANQTYEIPYDAQTAKKSSRSLVRRKVTELDAVRFALVTALSGGIALLNINLMCGALGILNLFLYSWWPNALGKLSYTAMKRRTWLNTQWGAIVGLIPPLIGYAAAAGGSISLINDNGLISEGWLVAALLFCWQFPHFYSLASMQDNSQGYTKAGYHMLSNSNQLAAKWWSLINNLIILAVHLYVYKYCDSACNISYINSCYLLPSIASIWTLSTIAWFFSPSNKILNSVFFISLAYMLLLFAWPIFLGCFYNHIWPQIQEIKSSVIKKATV